MKKASILVLAMMLLTSQVVMAKAVSKVIDPTKTTFGWQVYKDKESPTAIDVVAAENENKAVRLSYTMADSVWIALVKESTFGVEADEAIKFQYKCTGAVVNLKVKVADGKGNVFGYVVPAGTSVATWKSVVIPRTKFTHFYGGDGNLSWTAVTKFEFTLDKDEPATTDYKIDAEKPGTLSVSNIRIVKAVKK